MGERSIGHRARAAFRRRERRWIAGWLAGWTAALLGLAVVGIALQGAERLVDRWHGRWAEHLAECEELVAERRFAQAERRLDALDRAHPARTVVHARDRERERVLALLGSVRVELGRKRRALETFDRLVAFDPLNWQNHWACAEAALALDEPERALAGYADVLAMHGSHLPSVDRTIALFAEAGRSDEVVRVFEEYLDDWLLAPIELELVPAGGDAEPSDPTAAMRVALDVPVDGRLQHVRVPLALPAGWSGSLRVRTGGYSMELVAVALEAPPAAGRLPGPGSARLVEQPTALETADFERDPDGVLRATGPNAAARFALPAPPDGTARALVTLRLFKSLDPETWNTVQRSYRNLVREERLTAITTRVRLGGCPEAGTEFRP